MGVRNEIFIIDFSPDISKMMLMRTHFFFLSHPSRLQIYFGVVFSNVDNLTLLNFDIRVAAVSSGIVFYNVIVHEFFVLFALQYHNVIDFNVEFFSSNYTPNSVGFFGFEN